jgi:hypothetical protein
LNEFLGEPNGQGMYIWANGSVYIGEFKGGFKHGKGKWIKGRQSNSTSDKTSNSIISTTTYEGSYFHDMKHGFGEFHWGSGNIYRGNYSNDLRDGHGIMIWTDGN